MHVQSSHDEAVRIKLRVPPHNKRAQYDKCSVKAADVAQEEQQVVGLSVDHILVVAQIDLEGTYFPTVGELIEGANERQPEFQLEPLVHILLAYLEKCNLVLQLE